MRFPSASLLLAGLLVCLPAAATPAPPPATSGVDASDLLRQAYTAMIAGDLALATSLLDQAKALNPAQPGLWREYSSVAYKQGRHEEVIADLQQEIKINGRDASLYPLLADHQAFYGHMADVPETLRAWMKADPENAQPVARLVSTFDALNRPAEAVAAAEQALPSLPESARRQPGLLNAYALAEYNAGRTAAATATLVALLHDNTDPAVLNSAAYALADHGQELPLAESTESAVLTRLETATAAWTGKEMPKALAAQASTLYSSWDTMGWILFREGKLKQAEEYGDASFLNRPNPEVGGHLGDIRAALGDKTGARQAYLRAISCSTPVAGGVESPLRKAARESLEARAEAMKQAGAPLDPGSPLDDRLEVALGPAQGRDFHAEYRLLLRPGKVVSAEPTGTSSVSGGSQMITAMPVPKLFPAGSQAQMVKLAILNCHAETCNLIFEP